MNNKQVMQQALDALNESVDLVNEAYAEAVDLYYNFPSRQGRLDALKTDVAAHKAAIAALEAAIAQPVEPVAWRKANSDGFYRYYEADEDQPAGCEPLYAHNIAQPEQPALEIVGYQFQWTNPAGNPAHDGVLTKWEEVVPDWNQTLQQQIDQLLAYRYAGKPTYRVRVLYTSDNIAQPVEPDVSSAILNAITSYGNACRSGGDSGAALARLLNLIRPQLVSKEGTK